MALTWRVRAGRRKSCGATWQKFSSKPPVRPSLSVHTPAPLEGSILLNGKEPPPLHLDTYAGAAAMDSGHRGSLHGALFPLSQPAETDRKPAHPGRRLRDSRGHAELFAHLVRYPG